ncbi:MAG: TVP38/TMEM64 family protein [Oscillospiraceae bacterium]|jgi:uncharacterized membrane protein YdjX (TVP38/TMEM64 family)
MKDKATKLLRILPLLLVIALLCAYLRYGSRLTTETLLGWIPASVPLAVLTLLGIYALKSLTLFFPLHALQLIGGILYPAPIAILVNCLGAAVTVSLPYGIGKAIGNNGIQSLKQRFPKLNEFHNLRLENQLMFVLFVRIIGILPCDIVSLYMGMLDIPYSQYLLGCILGFLPSIVSVSLIGANIHDPTSPSFWAACILELAVVGISITIYRKTRK